MLLPEKNRSFSDCLGCCFNCTLLSARFDWLCLGRFSKLVFLVLCFGLAGSSELLISRVHCVFFLSLFSLVFTKYWRMNFVSLRGLVSNQNFALVGSLSVGFSALNGCVMSIRFCVKKSLADLEEDLSLASGY